LTTNIQNSQPTRAANLHRLLDSANRLIAAAKSPCRPIGPTWQIL
jgi:hypothetical protein